MRHTLRSSLTAALAIALAAPVSIALAATPMVSVYSDIARKTCRNLNPKPPSQLGDHEAVPYVCHARDFRIDIRYEGNGVNVRFTRKGDKPAASPQLTTGYDVGARVEWRGRGAGAKFRPEAAILRLQSRDDDGKLGAVLAVLRVDGGTVCPAAFVDAVATPRANEVARSAADAAASFVCGSPPSIAGADTPRARAARDEVR